MKKTNHLYSCLFLLGIIAFIASSCKKFLDQSPTTEITEAEAFKNISNAKATVLGVYNAMAGDNAFGQDLSMIFPYDDGDMTQYISATTLPDGSRRDLSRYFLEQSNAKLLSPWANLYSGVERANICIKNIPKMAAFNGSDSAVARRLYGEALALRAIFYMELVKHWGDVPVQWVPSADIADLNIGKTSQDEIHEKLLADLKVAEAYVPWRGDNGVGSDERLSKGAIKALRARIALYRGGYALRRDTRLMQRRSDYKTYYQISRDECLEIMQSGKHALNNSYQAVFRNAINAHTIEPNGEVMLEVAMTGKTSGTDSRLGAFNGPLVNNRGNRAVLTTPYYFYSFDSVDTRRDVTISYYTIDASNYKTLASVQNLTDGKFRRDWITNPTIALTEGGSYWGLNWPIIRYSDVLLMFAETENELNNGPTAAAKTAYEAVRKRAFGTNQSQIGTTPSDYAGFFNAIVKERSLEFGGEGITKYDLIRWNRLGAKLLEVRTELEKIRLKQAPYDKLPRYIYFRPNSTDLVLMNSFYVPSSSATISGWTRGTWMNGTPVASWNARVGSEFQSNKNELFPVPLAAIQSNTRLTQDYGY
jgi:hypothetical protein